MSLIYKVLKIPNNTYDCIDYSKNHKVLKIYFKLIKEEQDAFPYFMEKYIGYWNWIFEDKKISYQKIYAGLFSHEQKFKLNLSKLEKEIEIVKEKFSDILEVKK